MHIYVDDIAAIRGEGATIDNRRHDDEGVIISRHMYYEFFFLVKSIQFHEKNSKTCNHTLGGIVVIVVVDRLTL